MIRFLSKSRKCHIYVITRWDMNVGILDGHLDTVYCTDSEMPREVAAAWFARSVDSTVQRIAVTGLLAFQLAAQGRSEHVETEVYTRDEHDRSRAANRYGARGHIHMDQASDYYRRTYGRIGKVAG